MDSSIVNDGSGLHHQLIPHRDQSAAYGISSSASVHPSTLLPADKFLPPPTDPLAVFYNYPSLHLPPQDDQMPVAFPYPTPAFASSYETQDDSVPPGTREKRHCCRLCNKRFDRPSTLKKHMLVHTGEKAWACEICGRRFSVSSNLNRHARRCREKWVKADSLATDTPPSSALSDPPEHTESSPLSSSSPSSTSSSDGSDAYRQPSPQLTDQQKRRQSASGVAQYEIDDETRPYDQHHVAGKPYRRRRKGSPTEPWIPASLVTFNHHPNTSSASTPLPAVVPSTFEERNSYEDTPLQAYHPSWWSGRLVGPSYTYPLDTEGVSRGRYYGKLLVF